MEDQHGVNRLKTYTEETPLAGKEGTEDAFHPGSYSLFEGNGGEDDRDEEISDGTRHLNIWLSSGRREELQ